MTMKELQGSAVAFDPSRGIEQFPAVKQSIIMEALLHGELDSLSDNERAWALYQIEKKKEEIRGQAATEAQALVDAGDTAGAATVLSQDPTAAAQEAVAQEQAAAEAAFQAEEKRLQQAQWMRYGIMAAIVGGALFAAKKWTEK